MTTTATNVMKNTGERMIPDRVRAGDILSQTLLGQHLDRYRLAARFSAGRRVLDIACGSGYGSRMLLDAGARSITGVDCSPQAIEYARARYGAPGLSFAVGDAETFDGGEFDVIASFETLEHLPHPPVFLRRARQMLSRDGVLVISGTTVPTRNFYCFHLHDMDAGEFRTLVRDAEFEIVEELPQDAVFSLGELAGAFRDYYASLAVRRLIAHPLQALSQSWKSAAAGGFHYRNLTLVCRPR